MSMDPKGIKIVLVIFNLLPHVKSLKAGSLLCLTLQCHFCLEQIPSISLTVLLPWGDALCWRLMPAGCDHTLQICMGRVPPIASPSHQPHLPLLTRGKVYSSCVRCVMLHAAEILTMKIDTLKRLGRNDCAMIRVCQGKGQIYMLLRLPSHKAWHPGL